MADADKNILITPNRGQTAKPEIKFVGADNAPVYLRVLDDGTVSFEGANGQLLAISDSFSGTIFSVSDISGIPSIQVLDDGTIKLAPYYGSVQVPAPTSDSDAVNKSYLNTQNTIVVLDDIGPYFNSIDYRFLPTQDGTTVTITNQLRLILTIDGIIQEVNAPDYTWLSEIPRWGFRIDYEGYIQFTEAPPAGAVFEARLVPGSETDTVTNQHPFNAVDILIGV